MFSTNKELKELLDMFGLNNNLYNYNTVTFGGQESDFLKETKKNKVEKAKGTTSEDLKDLKESLEPLKHHIQKHWHSDNIFDYKQNFEMISDYTETEEVHKVALPFIEGSEIKVTPNERVLTVSVKLLEEHPFAKEGSRIITLLKDADIKAEFKDSILTLTCTYKLLKEKEIKIKF